MEETECYRTRVLPSKWIPLYLRPAVKVVFRRIYVLPLKWYSVSYYSAATINGVNFAVLIRALVF